MTHPRKLTTRAAYLSFAIILVAAAFSVLAQDDRSQGSHFKELRAAGIRSVQGAASAAAAPASAASAPVYTKADITKSTSCGASGIGEVWGGPRRGQIEYRDGVPGVRVNESGLWAKGCKMPPIPKDCPETEVMPWPGKDGALCTPNRLAPLRARNVGQEWSTQTSGFPYPTPGSRGESRWRCERQPDGSAKWVMLWSICHN